MTVTQSGGTDVVPEDRAFGTSLVERSVVPSGLPYSDYKEYLRDDFIYACAYCTITEFEAQGMRMTIDHYEPRNARPDLVNEYSNLMYCCEECNALKGDRCPPQSARVAGHRFFRPDEDSRDKHFGKGGSEADLDLVGTSTVGEFTVEYLDLNRPLLSRLRQIRGRLDSCHQHVVHGVLGLKKFPIDQLPPSIRGRAAQRIAQWEDMSQNYANDIDEILRGIAYSAMIGRDPEKEVRAERRAAAQKGLEGLYPGESWRAPRRTKGRARH